MSQAPSFRYFKSLRIRRNYLVPALIFSIATKPATVNIIVPATKHFIVDAAPALKTASAFTAIWNPL